MLFIDHTFETVEENLAFEEALLQEAEEGLLDQQVLRLWDATHTFIVLGRSSKVKDEVDVELAGRHGIPIYRRVSGGATILAAPGCFFYAVLLSLQRQPQLRMLDAAHRFVMSTMTRAAGKILPQASLDGTSDLVLSGRKFSGNSLRLQRNWLLYHGTLLLNMDLSLITTYLKHPPREPGYRAGRAHGEFLTNVSLPRELLADRLQQEWKAHSSYTQIPRLRMNRLISKKYGQASWNLQR